MRPTSRSTRPASYVEANDPFAIAIFSLSMMTHHKRIEPGIEHPADAAHVGGRVKHGRSSFAAASQNNKIL